MVTGIVSKMPYTSTTKTLKDNRTLYLLTIEMRYLLMKLTSSITARFLFTSIVSAFEESCISAKSPTSLFLDTLRGTLVLCCHGRNGMCEQQIV